MPLRPCGKGTAGLSDVSKAADRRHEHGVNIYLLKDGRGDGNGGRNPDLRRLSEQASAGKVVEVTGLLKSREVVPNQFDLFVGLACFVVKGDGWAVGGEVGSGGEFDTESPDCRAVISMRG